MIPVSLYGIDVEKCEAFYDALPGLVADTVDDEKYAMHYSRLKPKHPSITSVLQTNGRTMTPSFGLKISRTRLR